MALPRYTGPAPAGNVVRAVKGAQVLGKATEQAVNRRLKLSDALGKFRAGAGKQ